MSRLGNYLKDTKAEIDHISWPTRKQALVYTSLVVAVSAVTALYTAGFDFVFSSLLNLFISSY
jgi:preprotein translocase SecE subunit